MHDEHFRNDAMTGPGATHEAHTIVVVDLSALTISVTTAIATATLTSTGECLGTRPRNHGETARGTTAHLLDDIVATTRLWRDGAWRRIALYNPYTARMSLSTGRHCSTWWAGGPLDLAPTGTLATLTDAKLDVGGRTATQEVPDMEAVLATLVAHAR